MQTDTSIVWNGEFIINSPDGYAYAEGARDILSRTLSNVNSRVNALLSVVIFYLPIFLSYLLVFPVFFIALKSTIIQLGVLENYNPKLFEAITLNKDAKVYKVK